MIPSCYVSISVYHRYIRQCHERLNPKASPTAQTPATSAEQSSSSTAASSICSSYVKKNGISEITTLSTRNLENINLITTEVKKNISPKRASELKTTDFRYGKVEKSEKPDSSHKMRCQSISTSVSYDETEKLELAPSHDVKMSTLCLDTIRPSSNDVEQSQIESHRDDKIQLDLCDEDKFRHKFYKHKKIRPGLNKEDKLQPEFYEHKKIRHKFYEGDKSRSKFCKEEKLSPRLYEDEKNQPRSSMHTSVNEDRYSSTYAKEKVFPLDLTKNNGSLSHYFGSSVSSSSLPKLSPISPPPLSSSSTESTMPYYYHLNPPPLFPIPLTPQDSNQPKCNRDQLSSSLPLRPTKSQSSGLTSSSISYSVASPHSPLKIIAISPIGQSSTSILPISPPPSEHSFSFPSSLSSLSSSSLSSSSSSATPMAYRYPEENLSNNGCRNESRDEVFPYVLKSQIIVQNQSHAVPFSRQHYNTKSLAQTLPSDSLSYYQQYPSFLAKPSSSSLPLSSLEQSKVIFEQNNVIKYQNNMNGNKNVSVPVRGKEKEKDRYISALALIELSKG